MESSLVVIILLAAILLLQLFQVFRKRDTESRELMLRLDGLERSNEKFERAQREEFSRNREETLDQAKDARIELSKILTQSHEMLMKGVSLLGDGQKIELSKLTETNERKLEQLRAVVDAQLKAIQVDNALQLDRMRATVDEKLQGTLEKRLGESFSQVSERLELVHKGLGEMQSLASGVGDLKRALTNVKTRGTWGEVQLAIILGELLTPAQFSQNVKTNPASNDLVEFAIRLPGREQEIWLPIDSKFPIEDYQRLSEAYESADQAAIEESGKTLEQRIRSCAKDISTKYLHPPETTDFGIMFLPTEGLYAEVARRKGLLEAMQREYRIVVSGPATFAAFLSSLQLGFRTLAIEKRTSEVWQVLGAVKTEFGKFSDIVSSVKKKMEAATTTMDQVATRSRAIERKLRDVEALPVGQASETLKLDSLVEDIADEANLG